MSNNAIYKLTNLSVPPPPQVWEKVAEVLDEAAQDMTLKNKLNQLSGIPPAVCWNNIAIVLQEEGIGSKLNQLSVMPPANVWEKINAGLNVDDFELNVQKKLATIQVMPPVAAWNNITSALDAKENEVMVPVRRIAPIWKYAAAAAILSFLIWVGYKQLGTANKNGNEIALQTANNSIQQQETDDSNSGDSSLNEEKTLATPETFVHNDDAADIAALEKTKRTYARLDIPSRSKLQYRSNQYYDVNPDPMARVANTQYNGNTEGQVDMADRYVMLMTPDGNIIRVSKKFGNMVGCVAGEEHDTQCTEQIKKWQEKLATATTGNSSGNFMDIFELVNTLQSGDEL